LAVLAALFALFFGFSTGPRPLKTLHRDGEAFLTADPEFLRSVFPGGASPVMPHVWVAAKKPVGVRRVVLLGGSVGAGAPMVDYHLGRLIEARWRARFPAEPVEVINLSIDGADTTTLRSLAKSAMSLDPDMLVVSAQSQESPGAEADLRDIVRRALAADGKVLFLPPPRTYASEQKEENNLDSLQRKIVSDSGSSVALVDTESRLRGRNESPVDQVFFLDKEQLSFPGRVAMAELAVDGMAALWGLVPREDGKEAVAAWWQKLAAAGSEARRDVFFTGYDEHDMWSFAMKQAGDTDRRKQLGEKVRELRRQATAEWDTTDIIVAYERAQLQNAGDPATHFTAGRLLGLRGEGERAEEAFRRGFALQPHNPVALLNYAAMQSKRGDTESAREALDVLEKYDPQADGLLKMRAAVALREAELPQAAELLQKHLARNPGDAEAWLILSEVQLKLGDFAGSEASWQKGKVKSAP